jgi:hypothetical protein
VTEGPTARCHIRRPAVRVQRRGRIAVHRRPVILAARICRRGKLAVATSDVASLAVGALTTLGAAKKRAVRNVGMKASLQKQNSQYEVTHARCLLNDE